jgi:hypothetical protein
MLIEAVESADMAETELDEHLTCQGFISNHDSPSGGTDEQDILETEEEDKETMSPEMFVDTDVSEDEDAASSIRPLHLESEAGLR